MQQSPGRIESEYILRNFAETRPALHLQSGTVSFGISSRSYTITSGFLVTHEPVPAEYDGKEFRVGFSVRNRGFFFSTKLEVLSNHTFRFQVPFEVFRSDENEESGSECSVSFYIESVSFRSISSRCMPVDLVSPHAEFSDARREKLTAMAVASGFPSDHELLLVRLYDTLERIKNNQMDDLRRAGGCTLYVDHQYLLILAKSAKKDLNVSIHPFSVDIRYPSRAILVEAHLAGVLRVNAAMEILCLKIDTVQEEDRRFLYETVHHQLYTGSVST